MKFGVIEDSHVRKARAHFHAVRTLRELVSKENINFVRMRAINSKKIEKKIKKYESSWDSRYSGSQDVCTFLLCLDIVGARGEKNKF